jgi:hypothetical protein
LRLMKSKASIHTQSIPGIAKVKNVIDDLDKVMLMISRYREESQGSIGLLRNNKNEYERLNASYIELLREAGMAVLKWEAFLASHDITELATQRMSDVLKKHGVERYSPRIGDNITDNVNEVAGKTDITDLPPGKVAKVLSPGFRFTGGEVLVQAIVLESIGKPDSKE